MSQVKPNPQPPHGAGAEKTALEPLCAETISPSDTAKPLPMATSELASSALRPAASSATIDLAPGTPAISGPGATIDLPGGTGTIDATILTQGPGPQPAGALDRGAR